MVDHPSTPELKQPAFSEPLTPLESPAVVLDRPRQAKSVFAIGDHAFVASPYDEREGEPYLIARIQEFVGDDRVRVAFFLRPRDTGGRSAQHGRRLLASFHSDIVPKSFLRGLCYVSHKDRIPEGEEVYRRKPDHFYYNQLYDRYLHRYFDVFPTRDIRNAPENVLTHLQSSYEYAVCEASHALDLCNERQTCQTCEKWTTPADSVTCDMCHQHFHMLCLDPPLKRKPKLGFTFSCAPCALKREAEMEAYHNGETLTLPASAQVAPRVPRKKRPKARDGVAPPKTQSQLGPVKATNGWPFRYFGIHSAFSDVLDPHQAITPRAASRIGNRYQTLVPDQVSQPIPSTSKIKCPALPHARGSEAAVHIIAKPGDMATRNDYIAAVKKLRLAEEVGTPFIDRALELWHHRKDTALSVMSHLKLADFQLADWSPSEIEAIDEGLEEWQEDLDEIAKTLPKKKLLDVVNFVYQKRPHSQLATDEGKVSDKYSSSGPTLGLGHEDDHSNANQDLDDDSIAGTPPPSGQFGPCAVCETETASTWYRCPNSCGEYVASRQRHLCPECSFQWRHYANDTVFVPEEIRLKVTKPKATEKYKEESVEEESVRSPTPEPPPKIVLPPKPCVLCKRMEPTESLAQCQNCTLSGHAACYGIDDDIELEDWLCDLCDRQAKDKKIAKSQPQARWPAFAMDDGLRLREKLTPLEPRCRLCPEMVLLPEQADSVPLSALDALKPTEGNGLIHLICAVWHNNITFTNPVTYSEAEGVASVDLASRQKTCNVCTVKHVGACLKCSDCEKSYHVSCAWAAGLKFGFEFSPYEPKRNIKQPEPIYFKDSYGHMHAKIWCPHHKIDKRIIYDIGDFDPTTNWTALQTYVMTYKFELYLEIPAATRRGRRIDDLVRPALYKEPPPLPLPKAKKQPVAAKSKRTPAKKAKTKSKAKAKSTKKGKQVDETVLALPDAKPTKTKKSTSTAKPRTSVFADIESMRPKYIPRKRRRLSSPDWQSVDQSGQATPVANSLQNSEAPSTSAAAALYDYPLDPSLMNPDLVGATNGHDAESNAGDNSADDFEPPPSKRTKVDDFTPVDFERFPVPTTLDALVNPDGSNNAFFPTGEASDTAMQ